MTITTRILLNYTNYSNKKKNIFSQRNKYICFILMITIRNFFDGF